MTTPDDATAQPAPQPPYAGAPAQPGQTPYQGQAPEYPGQHQAQSPAAPAQSDALARIGVALGLVPLVVSFALGFIIPALVSSNGFEVYSLVYGVANVVSLIFGVGALVLGWIAAARKSANRLWAGIAIGLGGATVLGFLVNTVSSLIASAF